MRLYGGLAAEVTSHAKVGPAGFGSDTRGALMGLDSPLGACQHFRAGSQLRGGGVRSHVEPENGMICPRYAGIVEQSPSGLRKWHKVVHLAPKRHRANTPGKR